MCVILACETEFPTLELLESAELTNPHGSGVAWLDSKTKEVHFKKASNAKEIHGMIEKGIIELPMIFHARITSVGKTCDELTHPFVISKESELSLSGTLPKGHSGVLFHNGTVSNHSEIIKDVVMLSNSKMLKGEISDSRIMAFASAIYGHEFIPYLDNDSYNKYAILDSNGITKYGNWHDEQNGIKASNLYHRPAQPITNRWNFYEYGLDSYDELNDNDTFDYKYGHKIFGSKPKPNNETDKRMLEAREKIAKTIQKLSGKNPQSKRQRKKKARKLRRANVKFLKDLGWSEPERLSDDSLINWVEIEQERQAKKAKLEAMNLDDYETIFKDEN